jgi:hypothetical protein
MIKCKWFLSSLWCCAHTFGDCLDVLFLFLQVLFLPSTQEEEGPPCLKVRNRHTFIEHPTFSVLPSLAPTLSLIFFSQKFSRQFTRFNLLPVLWSHVYRDFSCTHVHILLWRRKYFLYIVCTSSCCELFSSSYFYIVNENSKETLYSLAECKMSMLVFCLFCMKKAANRLYGEHFARYHIAKLPSILWREKDTWQVVLRVKDMCL